MKKLLFDYTYKRNFWQAVAFYFISLIYLIFFGFFVGMFVFFISGADVQILKRISPYIAGLFVFAFSLYILKNKNLLKVNQWLALAIVAAMMGYVNAGFAGLLVTAYLTTLDTKNKKTR